MYITDFSMTIFQAGAFDDAGDVTVNFEVDKDDNRKTCIHQNEGDVEHQIFLDGRKSVLDLVKALTFLLENGWEDGV